MQTVAARLRMALCECNCRSPRREANRKHSRSNRPGLERTYNAGDVVVWRHVRTPDNHIERLLVNWPIASSR